MIRKLVALAAVVTLYNPHPADACSLIGNYDHELDAAHASDTVAPSAVMASADVKRSEDDSGCGAASSCGSLALVTIFVTATDNATPDGELGYQVRIVDGQPPRNLNLPQNAVVPGSGDTLYFYFDYADQSGFSVDLEIRARDLNGNLGPPVILTVSEPGEGAGCTTARTPTLALWLALALAFLLRRRRPVVAIDRLRR